VLQEADSVAVEQEILDDDGIVVQLVTGRVDQRDLPLPRHVAQTINLFRV
jgi:hypothetical protein